MTGVEHYLSIFTKAVFIENIVLAYFLGLCSFLAISKKIDASVGIANAPVAMFALVVEVAVVIAFARVLVLETDIAHALSLIHI